MENLLIDSKKSSSVLVQKELHDKNICEIKEFLNGNKFNFVITVDNLKIAKDENANLNKTIKSLKDNTKIIVDRESSDINILKEYSKEYQKLLDNKRIERVANIAVFENIIKEEAINLSKLYVKEKIKSLGIREMFNNIDVSDMGNLSNLTKGGALTRGNKGAINTLDSKIQVCLNAQNKYDLRVSQLANKCYESGLKSPMTAEHIQGIIFIVDNIEYENKLKNLINEEVARFERIEKQIKEEQERKAKKEAENVLRLKINEISKGFIIRIDEAKNKEELLAISNDYNLLDHLYFNREVSNRIAKKISYYDGLEAKKEVILTPETVYHSSPKVEYVEPKKEEIKQVQKVDEDMQEIYIIVGLKVLVKGNYLDKQIANAAKKQMIKAGFDDSIEFVSPLDEKEFEMIKEDIC